MATVILPRRRRSKSKRINYRSMAERWVEENPQAFAFIEELALGKAARKKRFGINQLREVFRWSYDGVGVSGLANAMSPYLARILIQRHPRLRRYLTCRPTADERAVAIA